MSVVDLSIAVFYAASRERNAAAAMGMASLPLKRTAPTPSPGEWEIATMVSSGLVTSTYIDIPAAAAVVVVAGTACPPRRCPPRPPARRGLPGRTALADDHAAKKGVSEL